jgi:hypothetical protein
MDGRELREAILHEHSGEGTPYEVEVWYDGAGEQYFKGGWSQFVDDHDIQRGFFITFDFHVGTSKFDLNPWRFVTSGKIYHPSFGGLKLSFHQDTCSGFDKVHIACLRLKGRSILVFLLLLLETSYYHSFPPPLLRIPRLLDFAFLGYPCCGVVSSVY